MTAINRTRTEIQSAIAAAIRDGILRAVAVAGLAGVALIHILDAPGSFQEQPWKGWLYIGLIAGSLATAAALVAQSDARAWAATVLLPAGALIGFVVSRTVGVPGGADDIGNWTEPLGLASLFVEGSLVALGSAVLARRLADRRLRAPGHSRRRGRGATKAGILGVVAAAVLSVGAASASAATAISSNWSGYAITGTTFKTVTGTWVQPTASCTTGSTTTASAFWVGLGGDTDTSNALEQTGTEADCLANGSARYAAWYELVPSSSVRVALKVSAGNKVTGTVSVHGTSVTLKLTNLTTHESFTKTLKMSAPDVSSAEWIAEAPSTVTPGGTSILPLTDFGTVEFSKTKAISTSGHSGTISDSEWRASSIELESRSGGGPGGHPFSPYAAYDGGTTAAIPSRLSSSGSAFSVAFSSGATTT